MDINTFYGPNAGGIRTYHHAKLEWFSRQREHTYYLIHPGPKARMDRIAEKVFVIQVPGLQVTNDPAGYRLILNYLPVAHWIRAVRPDVIEAGDAWLTSWFCLLMRATGAWSGLLVSFYHSDPVPTYLLPWARRGGFFRRVLGKGLARIFYAVQSRFDITAVASRHVEESLHAHGVQHTRHLPFGAHASFFHPGPASSPPHHHGADGQVRFLYAGRLDSDKGIELLVQILPELLEDPRATVTVAGRGAFAPKFESIRHPRFKYIGFLENRSAMAEVYSSQDVLLAPGPYETFGMAVLEGMACGLTVVGPNAGGTGELLEEADSPFRFAPGSPQDFLLKAKDAAASDLEVWSARHTEVARRYGDWDVAIGRMIATWSLVALGMWSWVPPT